MGGYQGQDFSKEFTERTLKVLEQMETIQNEFEATTLVNLALGLLVIPSEYVNGNRRDSSNKDAAIKLFGATELKEVLQREFPFHESSYHSERKGNSLNSMDYFDFLRLVRNGLAHGLIGFIGNPIQAIQISNRRPNGQENFRIKLPIDEFKDLMKRVAVLHVALVEFQHIEGGES